MDATHKISDYCHFDLEEVINLYQQVGWTNYVNRASDIQEAYASSLCVLGAYVGGQLVGIIRAVGDGKTIVFIQDIMVLPAFQGQGIGRDLMNILMSRYKAVYQMQLLTDNEDKTKAFYQAMGFRAVADVGCVAYLKS